MRFASGLALVAGLMIGAPAFAAEFGNSVPHCAAVTKSDTVPLTAVTTKIYVGGTGDAQVTMMDGSVVLFKAFPVGWQEIRISQLWSTNTTATNVVGCWQ